MPHIESLQSSLLMKALKLYGESHLTKSHHIQRSRSSQQKLSTDVMVMQMASNMGQLVHII